MNITVQIDTEIDADQAAILRGYLQEQATDAASQIVQADQGADECGEIVATLAQVAPGAWGAGVGIPWGHWVLGRAMRAESISGDDRADDIGR